VNEKKMRKSRWQTVIAFIIIIVLTYLSSAITRFNFVEGMATIPKVIGWIFSNLMVTQESIEKLPKILEQLAETIFMSIAATTIAAVVSLFWGYLDQKQQK
jgi:phosphonate transport system permease protein